MSDMPQPSAAEAGRRGGKSAAAFRTISEVSQELDVPQHVLRFWESKFSQVKPLKRGGGRRYYRPEDVELLRSIRTLLYRDGYTIKGVQKLLRERQIPRGGEAMPAEASVSQRVMPNGAGAHESGTGTSMTGLSPAVRLEIESVIGELTALRKLLRGV